MKIIGIEEHFVTADIRAAWAGSPIEQEGTAGFDRGEIEERLDDLGKHRLSVSCPEGEECGSLEGKFVSVWGPA